MDIEAYKMEHQSSAIEIFCCYASEDEVLLAQWETYLLPLQQAHLISCWSTRHVVVGADVEQERSYHLDRADLILLLLSADFFASKECLAVMHHALERQRAGLLRVIPLLLRPAEWQATELEALVPLPANGVPIVQWTIRDEAWHACVLGLQPILRRRLSASSSAFTPVRTQRRAASDRERMLGRLQTTYQELLDHSLQGIAWMELGLASKPDAVRNASHLLLRLPERDERILPPGTSILRAYAQAQEELLILGAPGAGKSTLLLNLALQLVEHAATDETHPLPVILPLSSWAARQPLFAEWLIEQLAHTYDIPRKLSKHWVEQESILPLLDGLDEMEETARSACIIAINTYHREHLTPLVVCSRQSEYEAAATRQHLVLQSAVVVQPLSSEHIEMSLRTAGAAFSDIRMALDQQPALRELATTPLMLSVVLLTYQGVALKIIAPLGADLEQRVWTDYVARMVQQKGNKTRYSLEQTRSYLIWLAHQMRIHQQTIFYAEYLDTDWLASNQQRIVTWLAIRIPAFVLGALACLLSIVFVSRTGNLGGSVSLLQMGLIGGFLGICLSQNVGAGTASVRRRPSASRRISLVSSIVLGVLVAASFGLSLSPSILVVDASQHFYIPGYSLEDWVRDGSILGLGSGLSAWIFQMLLFRVPKQQASVPVKPPSLRRRVFAWFNTAAAQHAWLAAAVFGIGMWLSGGLNDWLVGVLSDGREVRAESLSDALIQGLSFGGQLNMSLSVGLTALLINIILDGSLGTLRFAERIHWTWQSLIRLGHLRNSVIVVGVVFLLFGPIGGLAWEMSGDLSYYALSDGLGYGLSIGLSYWLLLGLYQGMKQEHIEDQDRHQFNQGVRRSLRNGVLMSLISASIIAGIGVLSVSLSDWLSAGLINGISAAPSTGLINGLINGLSAGLNAGLFAILRNGPNSWLILLRLLLLRFVWILVISGFLLMWAMSGGLTILRHYVIRWLLARSRHFPWQAQAFLDDATARILLQRVGGGYRYLHRRLLDYFADTQNPLPREEKK